MVESTDTLKTINKTLFTREEPVTFVVCPVKEISAFQKEYRDYVMTRARVPHCRAIPDNKTEKELIMAERLTRNPDFKKYAQEKGLTAKAGHITLQYEHFSLQEILKQLLPEGVEVPGGFEAIGQIAHLNLHEN